MANITLQTQLQLMQWDIDRYVVIPSEYAEGHANFYIKGDADALETEITASGTTYVAKIPNELLERTGLLMVYAYVDGSCMTMAKFRIAPNARPADYVIPESEHITYKRVEELIADMEEAIEDIPTNLSDFTNDVGFITNSYHDSTKQDKLTAGSNITITNNVISASGGGGGGSTAWADITGKPSTFPPSSHEHTASQISDFPSIPTDTLELTNGAGFITISSVPTDSHINDLIDAKVGALETLADQISEVI